MKNKINITKKQWQQIFKEDLDFGNDDYYWLEKHSKSRKLLIEYFLDKKPVKYDDIYFYNILLLRFYQIATASKELHQNILLQKRIWNKIKYNKIDINSNQFINYLASDNFFINKTVWNYIKKNKPENNILLFIIENSKIYYKQAFELLIKNNYDNKTLCNLFSIFYNKENLDKNNKYLFKTWNLLKQNNPTAFELHKIYDKIIFEEKYFKKNYDKLKNECINLLNNSFLGKCYLKNTFNQNCQNIILLKDLNENDILHILKNVDYNIEIVNWLKKQQLSEYILILISAETKYSFEAFDMLITQYNKIHIRDLLYIIKYGKCKELAWNYILNEKFKNIKITDLFEILYYNLDVQYHQKAWELLKKENLDVLILIEICSITHWNKTREFLFCHKEAEEMLSKLDLRLIDKLKMKYKFKLR